MNLILLEAAEVGEDGLARLQGRRARHAHEVLGAAAGDRVLAGVVGGRWGEAEVREAGPERLVLAPALDRAPPPPAPVSLLVAVPRPKILRKVLQATAAMGVKRLALVGSYRVEKSYFGSPRLDPAAMREELLLGLEQGRDTVLPEVTVSRFFKPFVEDELDARFPAAERLLAHPGAPGLEARPPGAGAAVVAIGPEGGWTPYEAEALQARGFAPFSLGPRVLRVDQAVPYAVGQAALWLAGRRAAP